MQWLFVFTLTVLSQNVLCQAEVLFKNARIRYVTDSDVHKIEQVQNLEYFNSSIIANGTHLRIITDSMPVLFEGSFRNIDNLRILQMPKCGITEIKPRAFLNLPNLDRIQLQDNVITRIESGVFNFMLISQLYLHRNEIEFIHSEAFDNMPNLYRIKLNGNNLKTWDSNWFYNTPKLTEILIRRNSITKLERNAFKNIKKLQVGHDEHQNSTSIYLSKNKISTIHPQALSDLVRLNQFYLDRNNLSIIPEELFAEIESISLLNLRRNRIESISPMMFPKISKFGTLDLTRNELDCIPEKVATQADKIFLEDNFIGCDCEKMLKKYIEEKGTKNSIVVGECTRNGDTELDGEADEEINDEEYEDEEK